jgi:two-component sensor histidine kinase
VFSTTLVDETGSPRAIFVRGPRLTQLVAELGHRVKNTLAVVSSLAERTLSDGEIKENLIGRLHALGHTHDVLSESGWTEAGLRELISAELSPHGAGDGTLQISGPPVMDD